MILSMNVGGGATAAVGLTDPTVFATLVDHAIACDRYELPLDADDATLEAHVAQFLEPVRPRPQFLIGGGTGSVRDISAPDNTRRVEPHELASFAGRAADRAKALRSPLDWLDFEILNEGDIATMGYKARPRDFREAVEQCHRALRDRGFAGRLTSGGVSNLNRRGIDYLLAMGAAEMSREIARGVHYYPDSDDPADAHKGFDSRDDEYDQAFEACGGSDAEIDVTECGENLAPRKWRLRDLWPFVVEEIAAGDGLKVEELDDGSGQIVMVRGGVDLGPPNKIGESFADVDAGFSARFLTKRVTEEQQAANLIWHARFFKRRGAVRFTVYQYNSGPTQSALDTYGMLRPDGSLRPMADALRRFAQEG